MKKSCLLAAVALFSVLSLAQAEDKIAYPTPEKASFVITVPSDWELTPADSEGDYMKLQGPTGTLFLFRTIEGSNDALEGAIKESLEDASDIYNGVKMGAAEDWKPDGLEGFYATGQGKEKKDGTPVRIAMAWCVLNDGKIAELWFVSDLDDAKGMELASEIANSLKSP